MRFQTLLVAAALTLAARAADPPDAPELIRQSMRASEAHASYEFESDMVMEMTIHGNPVKMPIAASVIAKPPNRIRVSSKMPMGEMLIVSDGQYMWSYFAAANQYTRKPVGKGALDAYKNFGFGSALEAQAAISRARVTAREEITIDGASGLCWVVEIPFDRLPMPAPAGAEVRDGRIQAWIDPNSSFVLRMETTGFMHLPGKPGGGEIKQSMTLRSMRVDTPVPDSAFEFTPPEGAREVSEFGKSPSPPVELAGKPAPALRVEALDGRTYELWELGGKVVLLDFWATWCAPCIKALPDLENLHREFSGSGLVVLGLAVNDDRAAVARLMEEKAVSFPVGMVDLASAGQFGVSSYPGYVIVDRHGVVSAYHAGAIGKERLLDALHQAGLNQNVR